MGRTTNWAWEYFSRDSSPTIVVRRKHNHDAIGWDMAINHTRALLGALIQRDRQAALAAISKGADPNAAVAGTRPLHIATIGGSGEMVKLLTDHGALPDGPDSLGRTALHYAALGSADADADLIDVLLKAGASVDAPDANGCTPLDLAVGAENRATALPLHQAGATCKPDRGAWVRQVSCRGKRKGPSHRGPAR